MDATVTSPAPTQVMQRRRTRWLLIAVTAFVVVGVGSTAYWWLFARNYEQTDDAYVAGDLVDRKSVV